MKNGFHFYHPYLSFSDETNYFISPNGQPSFSKWGSKSNPTKMSDDALSLWRLGKRAYDALGEINGKDGFDNMYEFHLKMVDDVREMIIERAKSEPGFFRFVDLEGKSVSPEIEDLRSYSVVDLMWQMVQQLGETKHSDTFLFMGAMFIFTCLEQIDDAIVGMCSDGGAICSALEAADAFANYQAIESGNENLQKIRSEAAARAAIERYKRDPKQAAKAFVKECWDQWKENPHRYKSQSSFANDVLTKVQTDRNGDPIISFDTVLKKWIPSWSKDKK